MGELGHALLAGFLRFRSDLAVRELIARIVRTALGLDDGRGHLADSVSFGATEFETLLGFGLLILFDLFEAGDAAFGDGQIGRGR